MNTKEKYDSLTIKSAWSYAKQKANFLDLYLSSKLFSEIPDISHTNVEDYFTNNYERYGISTNRHRILAIAQMLGLITKKELAASKVGKSWRIQKAKCRHCFIELRTRQFGI